MGSVLQIKNAEGKFIDIPSLRGKSAYDHAVDGGFKGLNNITPTEEEFNKLLANLVVGQGASNGESQIYQINFSGEPPADDTPDNVITIVLEN